MAATSGLMAVTGRNVAADLLAHITPPSATTATAVTITGPLKLRLYTSAITNTALGTECSDANYASQSVTAWNAVSTTTGAGYGTGYAGRTSNVALTYGGGGGFAVSQTLTGCALVSSDATPVEVAYQNFASPVVIPINNQYVVASGSLSVTLS
jgi:hypothetical protein